jgi:hypothetical protein
MQVDGAGDLVRLIGYATAPVVLFTASAILMTSLAAKHANVGGLLRDLAREYRSTDTSIKRRVAARSQIELFRRRVVALWRASMFLYSAQATFLVTTLEILTSARNATLTRVGALTLALGVVLLLASVLILLYELRLGRITLDQEVDDILEDTQAAGPMRTRTA